MKFKFDSFSKVVCQMTKTIWRKCEIPLSLLWIFYVLIHCHHFPPIASLNCPTFSIEIDRENWISSDFLRFSSYYVSLSEHKRYNDVQTAATAHKRKIRNFLRGGNAGGCRHRVSFGGWTIQEGESRIARKIISIFFSLALFNHQLKMTLTTTIDPQSHPFNFS